MDNNITNNQVVDPNQTIEKISLFRQIKQLHDESSKLIKIIILLVIVFVITVIGFTSYFIYDKYFNTPAVISNKQLTFDIPKEIINPPKMTSNEVEKVDKKEKKLIDSQLIATYSVTQINQISSNLYPSYSNQPAKYGQNEYTIHFLSTDEKGQPLKIKAQVFVPTGTEGEKFPIFVFGQGTTGIGDQCAPSKERPTVSNWGNYSNHLRTYAGQGFITVFPDYEGFNDDKRIHHYFIAQLEAHVLLDATRAAFEFLPNNSRLAAFYGGYSQGGHAAFAVKDLQPTYAPEIPIKGVIGFGATTNIINLLKENSDLAPYLFYSYADFYGQDKVKISELIAPTWLPTFEADVLGKCISTVPGYYGTNHSRVYSANFDQALFNNNLEKEFPELHKIFRENSTGLKSSQIPSLLIQGDPDPIVTVKSQEEFVNEACKVGSNITYMKYQGVHHFQTRHVSFKDVTNWMRNLIANKQPESICNHLNDLGGSVQGIFKDNSELNKLTSPPPGRR